ncbi:MAG: hypothetical protein R3F34_04785 [Planctomycetota bacterium]
MKRIVLAAVSLLALPLVLDLPAVGSPTAPAVYADALSDALAAVRKDPDDPEVHAAAAKAAKEADNKDRALFHARLAVMLTHGDRAYKSLQSDMESIITELDPVGLEADQAIELYLEQLCSQGESARARKLWANAVDLYLRCEGSPVDDKAQKGLDKIYSASDAGEALMKSGLDVPAVGGKSRKSAKEIAKFDEDYSEWEKAAKNKKLDVEGYKIRTNMGWEVGQQIGFALTQINEFLRGLFRHKEAGQKLRDCEIRVYKSHSEWETNEYTEEEIKAGQSQGVGGFFSPSENAITTYDQRTQGRTMDDLWETLFHEATHQFRHDVTKTLIPCWVNEGIACYMEGTVLLPNGAVIPNQVAESRLEQLAKMLERGDDYIRDVITFFQPGSYNGIFYPWGWGLIYFVRNYEDENCERVYLPYFDEYMKEYKGEAQHDVWARFEEYFVEKPGRPGINDFQAWNQLWRNWILDLADTYFGGPEKADKLIAKAQNEIAHEKFEYAVETLVWALDKRPGDPVAMSLMTEACLETDREDTALYYFRQLLEWCDAQPDANAAVPNAAGKKISDLRQECIRGMEKINRGLADSIVEKKETFEDQVGALAERYVKEGLPLSAALLVKRTQELAGRNSKLIALEKKIREDSKVDARLERDLVVDDDLSRWESFDKTRWRAGSNGTLQSVPSEVLSSIVYTTAPNTDRYRFDCKIHYTPGDRGMPIFGVTYGERLGRGRQVGHLPFKGLVVMRLKGEEPVIEDELEGFDMFGDGDITFSIAVDGNDVEYFVNGESVLKKMYPTSEIKGRVGFFTYDTSITVSDMKLTY